MNIIFLDIDGVLNSTQSIMMFHQKYNVGKGENDWLAPDEYFCPIAMSNLFVILKEVPNTVIVISSDWRLGETIDSMKDKFKKQKYNLPIIGFTPYLANVTRGIEIMGFMNLYVGNKKPDGENIEKFVILDDDHDMMHLEKFRVKTSYYHGLTWEDTLKAIDILKK